MECVIWKDKTVSFKEKNSDEVITTRPFNTLTEAREFAQKNFGTCNDLNTSSTNTIQDV